MPGLGILVSFVGLYLVIALRDGGLRFSSERARRRRPDPHRHGALGGLHRAGQAVPRPHVPLKYSALTVAAGTLVYIPLTWRDMTAVRFAAVSWTAWGSLVFSGIFALVLGYIVWYYSVQRVGNARTAVYNNLTPIFGAVFAALILGERLEPAQAAGAADRPAGDLADPVRSPDVRRPGSIIGTVAFLPPLGTMGTMSEPSARRRAASALARLGRCRLRLSLLRRYNILVFDRVPHIHDETVYLFQAQIFLSGHVTAPLPPVPEAFDFPHVVNVGRWYTIYPPGFPFLLALGLLAGAPWLINPILAALAVLLFYWLGTEIYDRRTGVLAAILGSLSIWLLLMSSTMMSHTASMVFNAVFLLFFFRSLRAPTFWNGLAAGAGLGLAFLIRPYNAAVFALPFLVVLAVRSLARLKLRWKNLLALALAGLVALGIFLAYNAATTGDPLEPGYIARYGRAYSVIFGRAGHPRLRFHPARRRHSDRREHGGHQRRYCSAGR